MTTAKNLAQIAGFIRAVAGELPDPQSISVGAYDVQVIMHSADDVREWAAYLQGDVTVGPGNPEIGQEHITYTTAICRWVEGATFRVVSLDYDRKPVSA